MRTARLIAALIASLTIVTFTTPAAAQGRWDRPVSEQVDRAYRLGYGDGVQDARQGRAFEFDHENRLRRNTREFRNAYAEGYRAGFESFRPAPRARAQSVIPGFAGRGAYQDPALSRGLSEGYRRGFEDGKDHDRYDPVRHGEYRDGDNGYFGGYGPKDAYKNSYRGGFRQGYEEGYRDGTGGGRR